MWRIFRASCEPPIERSLDAYACFRACGRGGRTTLAGHSLRAGHFTQSAVKWSV